MKIADQLVDIFGIMHDGTIVEAKWNDACLYLKIEISYLAELIDKKFENFRIRLDSVSQIEFEAWPARFEEESKVLDDLDLIFAEEIEILSAERKGDAVHIACSIHNSESDYCGGELRIVAKGWRVVDDAEKEWQLEQLGDLCEKYWNAWEDRNKKRYNQALDLTPPAADAASGVGQL